MYACTNVWAAKRRVRERDLDFLPKRDRDLDVPPGCAATAGYAPMGPNLDRDLDGDLDFLRTAYNGLQQPTFVPSRTYGCEKLTPYENPL